MIARFERAKTILQFEETHSQFSFFFHLLWKNRMYLWIKTALLWQMKRENIMLWTFFWWHHSIFEFERVFIFHFCLKTGRPEIQLVYFLPFLFILQSFFCCQFLRKLIVTLLIRKKLKVAKCTNFSLFKLRSSFHLGLFFFKRFHVPLVTFFLNLHFNSFFSILKHTSTWETIR